MSRLRACSLRYRCAVITFPLCIILIFSACSLPPKPRLINKPFEQPAKSPAPHAREKRERQKAPPPIDDKQISVQPISAAAPRSLNSSPAKKSYERLLSALSVFFEETSRRGHYISHVGIYLANRRFVHAGIKAGVVVSSLDEAYWRRRFAGARRLVDLPQ